MLNRLLAQDDRCTEPLPAASGLDVAMSGTSSVNADTVVISVASWIGRRSVCEANVLGRTEDELTLLSPTPFEKGQFVWLEGALGRSEYVVSECEAESGACRIRLRARQERRRDRRASVSVPAQLDWLDGLSRRRMSAELTNLSERGAQLRVENAAPERGRVTVRFNDRTRQAEVRYSMRSGDVYVVGVEFDTGG